MFVATCYHIVIVIAMLMNATYEVETSLSLYFCYCYSFVTYYFLPTVAATQIIEFQTVHIMTIQKNYLH